MGRTAAAVGGFLLGSAVTVAVTYYLSQQRSPQRRKQQLRHSSAYAEISSISRVGFLTDLIVQLWSYINVAGSATLKETIEPMFADMGTPLSSCRFVKVDLGEAPLKLDNIVVHDIQDGMLQFDLDVSWNADCEITLKADYIGAFGIRKILLEGRLCVLLKPLASTLPVISGIQYAFINPPTLELDFTGVASVADVGFVEDKIAGIMQDVLKGMMVLPNRMLYKMDPATSFLDTYEPPMGIARITAVKGRGFQVETKSFGRHDVPDVYCNISLGDTVWRTKTIKDSLEPEWNESCNFLLCDHDQIITLEAFDEDRGALDADDELGSANITVGEILLAGKTVDLELQHADNNYKGTGAFVSLHCDVYELTADLGGFETQTDENQVCGLLTIVVTKAFEVPLERKQAATFVKISCGSCKFATSAVADAPGVDSLNPAFDCVFYAPVNAAMMADKNDGVVFDLINGVDSSLGTLKVPFSFILSAPDKKITEKRKIGEEGASLEFRVTLQGIKIEKPGKQFALRTRTSPSNLESPKQTVEPIGVVGNTTDLASSAVSASQENPPAMIGLGTVRVTAVKGTGFKVKKKLFKKDIPDIYCKIKFGSSSKIWRTSTVRNNTNPEWNEHSDYILTDHGQMINVDVFDENRRSDDEAIGSLRIPVGKLLLKARTVDLELQRNGKGTGAFISIRCDMV